MAKMTIEAAARQSEKNAQLRREAEELVAAQAQNATPEEAKMSSKPVAKPVAKPAATKKAKPICGCGCGARTGGGVFRPGHDAKLKSELFKRSKAGDEAATAELVKRNWLYLMAAPKVTVRKPTRVEQLFAAEDDAAWTALLEDTGLAGMTI